MPQDWGFWTEVKLDTLERYLESFTTASKKARSRLYLDLFAGRVDNVRRDDLDKHFTGSTVRALETRPPFDNLYFFELPPKASLLEKDLSQRYPNEQRYQVIAGDCNETIHETLRRLQQENLHWAPTFALVDPSGLDVKWSTLSAIATFKHWKARTKAEIWVLLSHTTVSRLAGFDASRGLSEDSSAVVTSLFGTSKWRLIYERRASNKLSAEEARRLYVDLFRFRLERLLGYNRTLTIEMGNVRGAPIYTMVFATDSDAGDRIMSNVYTQALEQAAEYRADVLSRRERQRREETGNLSLFDVAGDSQMEEPRFFESVRHASPAIPDWLQTGLGCPVSEM